MFSVNLLRGTVALWAALLPMLAHPQSVISRRTEVQTTAVVESVVGPNGQVLGEVVPDPDGSIAAQTPGAASERQEREVSVLAFQLPSFNAADLRTHHYWVSFFWESGNGSGTLRPDETGYAEFEFYGPVEADRAQFFVHALDRETGMQEVFIDLAGLTVNRAIEILNGLATRLIAGPQTAEGSRERSRRLLEQRRRRLPIGNERYVSLHGDYLTPDDLQEQIYAQTHCNVEQEQGVYYLKTCD